MANPFDLLGAWREAVQKLEQEINSGLNAASGDERFSRVMNRTLALYARLQAAQAEAMEKALKRANLPSKADFRHLHERLDTLEAQIATLAQTIERASGAASSRPAAPQPARTRQPPAQAAPPPKPEPTAAKRKTAKPRKTVRAPGKAAP